MRSRPVLLPSLSPRNCFRRARRSEMPYRTATQIESELRDLATAFPALCTFDFCPNQTVGGRRVPFVKISHPEAPTTPRIGVLILGGVHAREWAPPDALVGFVR